MSKKEACFQCHAFTTVFVVHASAGASGAPSTSSWLHSLAQLHSRDYPTTARICPVWLAVHFKYGSTGTYRCSVLPVPDAYSAHSAGAKFLTSNFGRSLHNPGFSAPYWPPSAVRAYYPLYNRLGGWIETCVLGQKRSTDIRAAWCPMCCLPESKSYFLQKCTAPPNSLVWEINTLVRMRTKPNSYHILTELPCYRPGSPIVFSSKTLAHDTTTNFWNNWLKDLCRQLSKGRRLLQNELLTFIPSNW